MMQRYPLRTRTEKRPRKKVMWLLLGLFAAVLLLCANALPAEPLTEEQGEGMEEVEKNIDELMKGLDTEELQKYLNSLTEFHGVNFKERLKKLITGDYSLEYDSMTEAILALVWEDGKAMIPAFAIILAIALLCGILNSAKSGFIDSTMSDIIHFLGYIAVGATVLACLIGVLESGFSALREMQRQMQIVYPLLLTLMAASGGAVSAGVFRPAVAFMSSAICELFMTVVLPSSVIVIVLAFIGNLTDEVRTERLGDLFKSICKWLVGFTLALMSIFLTVQGLTSAQYDGLSLRAAKYVISGSVPLVGGFLSGGMELVVAGSALIKNALGSFAVFLLFATVLRPVLLIAAFQLFLRLSAAATEPVGGKISPFLSRLAGDCGYFLAGILCVAFLYFLTLILLICATGVIF